jgi:microcystin-dependent protein
MAFDSLWLQNVDYPARIDRTVFDNIWTEGILGSGSLAVSQSAPTAMSVQVAAGTAVVQGDDQTAQGKYLVREILPTTGVAISAAPGSGSRHDLVVLKVNDPNAGGTPGDDSTIVVVTGTPSASPVDPAVPASALVLARVRVPAGTGVITNALIDDLRVASYDAHNTIAPGSVDVADLSPAALASLTPTGAIVAFGGSAAPSGWLLCDGSAYATATYPALSAVLAGAYDTSAGQASPGAGNFRVPILKGRVPAGLDVGVPAFATLGSAGGAVDVTLTAAESGVASHTHSVSATGTSGNNSVSHSHTFTTASDGSHSHTIDLMGQNLANLGEHKSASSSNYAAGEPDGNNFGGGSRSGIVNSGGSHTHTGTTASNNANHTHAVTVSGNATAPTTASAVSAHNNLQPYLTINYMIKT